MDKHFCLLLFLLSLASLCSAQRMPSWMNELPHPGNDTYLYVRESGEGPSLIIAENVALLRVMQSTAHRIGRPFDAQQVDFALSHSTNLSSVSRQYNIPINKVDKYEQRLDDTIFRVWVLCQVAVSATMQPQWDEVRREGESNNLTAMLKSAVIPGLGQLGKGHTTEGMITLSAEALLVGTGIACYYIAQADLRTMRDVSSSFADFSKAHDRYDILHTTSYVVWSAAAILYSFNLCRAFFMQPRRVSSLTFYPTLIHTYQHSPLGFNLSFNL